MRLVYLFAILLSAATTAHAQPTPWADGVSEEKQELANKLVAEANQLFAERAHTLALDKYKEALAAWDHPTIRFNMAVKLIRLDRLPEAGGRIQATVRQGPGPFNKGKYEQRLDCQA